MTPDPDPPRLSAEPHTGFNWLRTALGGALMGLANLVPGLSGGTMLVAIGIYSQVIDAISEATRLKFSTGTILTLAVVTVSAGVAIGGLASVISYGLAEARWAMYAAFIGLTWGGAPLLIRMTRPFSTGAWAGLVLGIVGMLALVWVQESGGQGAGNQGGPIQLGIAGAAGASAMILPGVSGAYLLLMLGQYDRIIEAIKETMKAAGSGDVSGVTDQLGVIVPVGVGVLVGIVVVSNVLRFLIHRFERPTYGVLLGLLLAAPAGLYPFVEGVPPAIGETFEGEPVTEANVAEFAEPEHAKHWAIRRFSPGPVHIGGVIGLVAAGFFATVLLSKLENDDDVPAPEQDQDSAG